MEGVRLESRYWEIGELVGPKIFGTLFLLDEVNFFKQECNLTVASLFNK